MLRGIIRFVLPVGRTGNKHEKKTEKEEGLDVRRREKDANICDKNTVQTWPLLHRHSQREQRYCRFPELFGRAAEVAG